MEEEKTPNYFKKIVWSIVILFVILKFFIWVIPKDAIPAIIPSGSLFDWIITSRYWLLWAAGVNIFIYLRSADALYKLNDTTSPRDIIKAGVIVSLIEGIWEEVAFRYLFFLVAIVTAKITNYILFGFMGCGLTEWFYLNLFGPIANFATCGYLRPWLFFPGDWAVGAAILSTNAFFRDGHKYQGWSGWINSWFCGMFFFYLCFTYGLGAAIVMHVLYDIVCFASVSLVLQCARLIKVV